jgi:hypothetical protein
MRAGLCFSPARDRDPDPKTSPCYGQETASARLAQTTFWKREEDKYLMEHCLEGLLHE